VDTYLNKRTQNLSRRSSPPVNEDGYKTKPMTRRVTLSLSKGLMKNQTNPFFLCGSLCRSVANMQNKPNFPHFQSKIKGRPKNEPKTGARQRKLSDIEKTKQTQNYHSFGLLAAGQYWTMGQLGQSGLRALQIARP
jgi:hypothetical protein